MDASLSRGMGRLKAYARRVARAALSVPIRFKVVGILLVMAAPISAVMLHQIHHGVSHALRAELKAQADAVLNLARHEPLSDSSSPPSLSVDDWLESLVSAVADGAVIVIEDEAGGLVAAAGNGDLGIAGDGAFVVSRGMVDEPVPGVITVGLSTAGIDARRSAIVWRAAGWLAVCVALGAAVAVGLTRLLVRPIRELLDAAASLRDGDYETRARVYSGDEIGQLARMFNGLAETLQARREEAAETEAARVSLIQHIVEGQEAERKALARNLHDEIGQSLSHLLIEVQGLCQKCANTPQLCEEVRGLIDETRRLAWDFRPSILDDYGLESALRRYMQEHCESLGINVACECVNLERGDCCDGRLPGEVEVTLYRIAQEALTNVIRHAGARHVSVVVLKKRNEASLIIEDDGCGFDAAKFANGRARSLGLMGMRERAQLLGGDVAVESKPGHGTEVRVTVAFGQTGP